MKVVPVPPSKTVAVPPAATVSTDGVMTTPTELPAALAELDIDIADLDRIAPPPHAALLSLLARITSGAPEVYWDVQAANPYAPAARHALWPTWHAWLVDYRELLVITREVYEGHHGQRGTPWRP